MQQYFKQHNYLYMYSLMHWKLLFQPVKVDLQFAL